MDKPFQRPVLTTILQRLSEPRKFIPVIMGPRQVGKTTLAQQALENLGIPGRIVSCDAVPGSGEAWLEQIWEAASVSAKADGEYLLIIDEIQKITNWSEVVKKHWDADTRRKARLKVMLLGSSRLLLQQGLTESLAGRFETIHVGHWSLTEMATAFGNTPEEFVWFGGYPGAAGLIRDEFRWRQYVLDGLIEPAISRDILMLTRVHKPALLRRLFDLGSGYSGQILSYNKILGQLLDAGNTTTLAHYLGLLDTAGLLCGLEKFSASDIRSKSSSPKFQVHNTALLTVQKQITFAAALNDPAVWGRQVESVIGAHLINGRHRSNYEVWYWREGNDEVDFVMVHRGRTIAIEVKSGTPRSISGMGSFRKKYRPHKVLLVGDGGIPWQEFLKMDPLDLFQ